MNRKQLLAVITSMYQQAIYLKTNWNMSNILFVNNDNSHTGLPK